MLYYITDSDEISYIIGTLNSVLTVRTYILVCQLYNI